MIKNFEFINKKFNFIYENIKNEKKKKHLFISNFYFYQFIK